MHIKFFFIWLNVFLMQHLWLGRFTLGEDLVLVLSVESMVAARGTVVAHLTFAKAAEALPVTSSSSWRQWTLLSSTPKGNITTATTLEVFLLKDVWAMLIVFTLVLFSEEEESLPVANGIWTRLLAVLQLNLEDLNVLFLFFYFWGHCAFSVYLYF